MATKRTSKRSRAVVYYACSTHRNRGQACSVKASLNATEAHERITHMFLTKILTPDALKQAVDALVKKGNEAEMLAAQRAPHRG